MNLSNGFLLLLWVFTGCVQNSPQKGQRELVPNPEKYTHDGYASLPDSLKPRFEPDTSIGEIFLINSQNVPQYLGEDIMDRLEQGGLPNASVFSQDGKQRLTVYFHPGGVKNEFSEFQVEYAHQTGRKYRRVESKEFETESQVKLGMTMGTFRALKGEPDSISNEGPTTFFYTIDDMEHSDFLGRYLMPLYYATYTFENGYLVAFKFGFEYP